MFCGSGHECFDSNPTLLGSSVMIWHLSGLARAKHVMLSHLGKKTETIHQWGFSWVPSTQWFPQFKPGEAEKDHERTLEHFAKMIAHGVRLPASPEGASLEGRCCQRHSACPGAFGWQSTGNESVHAIL